MGVSYDHNPSIKKALTEKLDRMTTSHLHVNPARIANADNSKFAMWVSVISTNPTGPDPGISAFASIENHYFVNKARSQHSLARNDLTQWNRAL